MKSNQIFSNLISKMFFFFTTFEAVVLLLTTILFYQFAFVQGFFHDGYLYASFGKTIAETNNFLVTSISQQLPNDVPHHPPLFFILEGIFFKIFGSTYQSIRLFMGLFIFLSIYFLHLMFKSERRPNWGKLTLLIFILIPPLFKKTRSPNLDIPLMTFILGSLAFYFLSYKNSFLKKYWFLSGTFFGLALLTKGFPSLIIPFVIFNHLLVSKKINILFKSITPWLSLTWGIALFLLWPTLLFLLGRYDIFENYIQGQFFGTIVEGRGNEGFKLWVYPHYLLENAGLWFLLSLMGIFYLIKSKFKNDLSLLFTIFYLSILLPFSFVKWKYSNYIVPMFPAMAAMASIPLISFFENNEKKIKSGILFISILTLLILTIFPLTSRPRREKELLEVHQSLKTLEINQSGIPWLLVNNIYPYHNLYNYVGYHRLGTIDFIESHNEGEILNKIISYNKAYLVIPYHLYKNNLDFFNKASRGQIIGSYSHKNLIFIYFKND